MMTRAPQFIDPKQLSGNRDAVQQVLTAGKGPDGTPLSESIRLWYEYAVGQVQAFLPELEQARLAFPTQTFQDSITVYLGKREVQVRFLGRANTGGDAVVYVPDARVLATGDLVVHPYPYIFGSFVGEWIETMRKLLAIDAVAIVPGHGAVEYDKSYVTEVTELLESLQSQAQALVKEGVSMEDARRRFDLDRFRKQMCPEASPFCETGFRQSMAAAGVRAWREAKEGKLKTEQ
jgi:cyclase